MSYGIPNYFIKHIKNINSVKLFENCSKARLFELMIDLKWVNKGQNYPLIQTELYLRWL